MLVGEVNAGIYHYTLNVLLIMITSHVFSVSTYSKPCQISLSGDEIYLALTSLCLYATQGPIVMGKRVSNYVFCNI